MHNNDNNNNKQPIWDRPGVLESKAKVEANLASADHRASFLVASCQHSGNWLFALPIASCGLKLDDGLFRTDGKRLDGLTAASRKEEKYANIGSQYLFVPIAVETMGPLNTSACQLFGNLGRKISSSSGDDREGAFLFQRVSVIVQRFNAVLLQDSLPTAWTDRSIPNFVYLNFLNSLGKISTEGLKNDNNKQISRAP